MAVKLDELSDTEIAALDIRAVFFDVDGTILDEQGSYSDRLRNAIKAIQARGIKTGIASGRPSFACQFLFDDLNLVDIGVFCTGAEIFEPKTGFTLVQNTIAPELVSTVLAELRNSDLYYEIYTPEGLFYEYDRSPEIRRVHESVLQARGQHVMYGEAEISASKVTKFLIGTSDKKTLKKIKALESDFPSLIFAYAQLPGYTDWCFANIISQSACKEAALTKLQAHLGVPLANMASFGDSQSDMVFLSRVGVGVAMGNATSAVKSVAKYETHPVSEDGLAYALERLVLKTTYKNG